MRPKVWKTLLILSVIVLVLYNIYKLFLPNFFIMQLQNTQLLKFGEWIEAREWAYIITNLVLGFVSYYIWGCIASKRYFLNWWQTLIVLAFVGINFVISLYLPTISAQISTISILLLAFIMRNNCRYFTLYFCVHMFSQLSILFVRGYVEVLPSLNFGSNLCLYFENLFLLLIFYMSANSMKKKEKENEFHKPTTN